MKIFGHIDPDQFLLSEEAKLCEVLFLGECCGVGLSKRGGEKDPDVCFTILVEDDGHWFITRSGQTSMYWWSDLRRQMDLAEAWLKTNAEVHPWGWKFR